MTERPSRGPRRDYAPVAGSEDDSNNGNDSIDESEFETQLSIGSESSIDYHGDDNDDHEGTALDNAIELLSPPDEIEEGTGVDNAIELLSLPDEIEGEETRPNSR